MYSPGSKAVCGFSNIFIDILKPKSPRFLLNKNIKFDKNETEAKMKNSTHWWTMCFQLVKELRIKSKTVIIWSSRKKK